MEVLASLKEHVTKRGLCLPDKLTSRRRPRTLFFSPTSHSQAAEADNIWEIDYEGQLDVAVANLDQKYDVF